MKNLLTTVSSVAMAACVFVTPVYADAGDLLVRLRGIHVMPNESATITAIGGDAAIDTATVPELDFTYFFTDKLAAELILGTTKHHPVAVGTAAGDVPLGSVYLLPPTLTLQYHPLADETFSPYVGVGVNYTLFYNSKEPAAVVTDIDYSNSFGLAAQAGVDYWISDTMFINFDVKKIWLNTDVSINSGAIMADVKINPVILGFGVGMKF